MPHVICPTSYSTWDIGAVPLEQIGSEDCNYFQKNNKTMCPVTPMSQTDRQTDRRTDGRLTIG